MAAAPTLRFWPSLTSFLRDFLRYAGRRIVGAGLLVASGALAESLGIVTLVPILGLVVETGRGGGGYRGVARAVFERLGATTQFEQLALLLGVFCVFMLLRAVLTTWRDIRLASLQIGFLESLRGDVAELLAGARWDQLARLRHARITHLISGDVQRVAMGASFMMQTAVSLVMLGAYCGLTLVLQPALGAFALALIAVMGLAVMPMVRRSQRLGDFVTRTNLSLLDDTTQFLGGLKLAISQNLQSAFTAGFRETLGRLKDRQIENIRHRSVGRVILTLVSSAVAAAIVLIGFGVLHAPAPQLFALLFVITRMSGPVGQIQQGLQQVANALPAYEQVSELKAELAAASAPAARVADAPFPTGDIVFAEVSFRHAGEGETERGVQGVSLAIRPGELVGLGGPSGAGKTTFADLLVGLFPPQLGRITVGGAALEGQTLAAWREGVAYVSQDPFLFHDTIRANLAWARHDLAEADMWRALALVEADEMVRRMDGGLDSMVGERGALVSGGERQRLALARAILRQPRLLVLDEATNAIDVAAEARILNRLVQMTPQPTLVMIAHRPESLALCRRVLQIEDGRLAPETAARAAGALAASRNR